MKYYVLSAEDACRDLDLPMVEDDIIVITDDKDVILAADTKEAFKEIYGIASNNVNEIAEAVIMRLNFFGEKVYSDDDLYQRTYGDEEPILDDYFIFDFPIDNIESYLAPEEDKPFTFPFEEPECKVTEVEVTEEVDSKIVIELKNVVFENDEFLDLKIMNKFIQSRDLLMDKRDRAKEDHDQNALDIIYRELESLYDEVLDEYHCLIKVDATKYFEYENCIMVYCENGQKLLIDKNAVEKIREHAIEYEKQFPEGRKRVHYTTINIELKECFNELCERGDFVYLLDY